MIRRSKKRDNGLDTLLILDGETFGMNTHGCWVKFEAHEVDVTESVPHGISYSLTLHSKDGKRIFGMDNAHAAEDGRNNYKARVVVFDHLHPEGKKNSRPYKFESVDKLISDFWRRVDKRIKELYE
jgi:hypothetical protein